MFLEKNVLCVIFFLFERKIDLNFIEKKKIIFIINVVYCFVE